MRKTAILLFLGAAFAAVGCGSQPKQAASSPPPTQIVGTPPPAAPAPPPAQQPEQPPAAQQEPEEPEQPAEPTKDVTCKVPGGWFRIPSSRLPDGITAVFVNPEKHGQVVIRPAPEGKSTAEQAAAIHKLIADNNKGIKLSKVTSAKDGKSSSFTIDAGEVHAKLVVRKLGDDSYSFLAKWEAKNEKDLAKDAEQIISTAKIVENDKK